MRAILWIKAAMYVAIVIVFLMEAIGASAAALMQDIPPSGGPFDLPVGSDYVLATLVVGFLMSVVISFLNGATWQPQSKAIGAFVWCLLAAAVLLFAGGQLNEVRVDFRSLFSTFLVVFVMAIGLYNFYFKPSGIAASVSKLGIK